MPRGTEYLKEWELKRIQEQRSPECPISCGNPGCSWTYLGPVWDGAQAFKQHLRDSHPEIKARKLTRRQRPSGIVGSMSSDLDENIANVREQGGAAWSSEAA